MQLTSTSFKQNDRIPEKYTGVGADISPQLAWSIVPDGTKSLALICDDPDAPSRKFPRPEGPWVHWVIYNISPDVNQLPEGLARQPLLADHAGVKQGKNDWPDGQNVGYRGPMPPQGSGPHRYFFKIYALDTMLDLDPSQATKKTLLQAIDGHILGQGELMASFERE